MTLRRERNKLKREPPPNLTNLKTRETEFSYNIQNKYSFFSEDLNIDKINKMFNDIIVKAAPVGGKNDKQGFSKLSVKTK